MGRNDKELNIGASKPKQRKMYHSPLSGRKEFFDPQGWTKYVQALERRTQRLKSTSDMDKYIKGNDGGNAKNTRVF